MCITYLLYQALVSPENIASCVPTSLQAVTTCAAHACWETLQVLTEIAGETLEQMAAAPKNKAGPSSVVAAPEEEEEEDTEAADLQARLNAIRS